MSKTINLRDFYAWYTHDELVEVSDEIAAELFSDKRYHKTHERTLRRNNIFKYKDKCENHTLILAGKIYQISAAAIKLF